MTLFGLTFSTIVFWLIIALIMLIVEALTAGLTTIWFAGGAFAALVCALLDLPDPTHTCRDKSCKTKTEHLLSSRIPIRGSDSAQDAQPVKAKAQRGAINRSLISFRTISS